jgi:hypothetical protein
MELVRSVTNVSRSYIELHVTKRKDCDGREVTFIAWDDLPVEFNEDPHIHGIKTRNL